MTSAASSKPSPTASTRSEPRFLRHQGASTRPRDARERHSAGEAGAGVVGEVEVADAGDGVGAHLLQGLVDDAVELLRVQARGEVVELGLEEHEAERVLERLHLGVLAEPALAHEILHPRDRAAVVADAREDLPDLARVLLVQIAPPAQVARPAGGSAAARDGPPPPGV